MHYNCLSLRILLSINLFLKVLANCGDPGAPINGQKLGSSYWTGESVTLICHPGYRLIGPAVRRCLPFGKWSGVQPSCISGKRF